MSEISELLRDMVQGMVDSGVITQEKADEVLKPLEGEESADEKTE